MYNDAGKFNFVIYSYIFKSLIEAQHMSLTQQGQSINNLVQSVMRLSVRLHQQTCSLDCLTKLLKRQEVGI